MEFVMQATKTRVVNSGIRSLDGQSTVKRLIENN